MDWEWLKKIVELELSCDHECFHARNYFVASYLMYGMNFLDMGYLEKMDIVGGRINYRRGKTGKLYDIKITPTLETILAHYISLPPRFPLVSLAQNRATNGLVAMMRIKSKNYPAGITGRRQNKIYPTRTANDPV